MTETAQQYVDRVVGYLEGKNPLTILGETPKKLTKLLKGVPAARLKRRPQPDKWSAAEILAHLVDSEIIYGCRLRLVFARNGVPIQGTDQDVWAGMFRYNEVDPKETLMAFTVLRAWNLRALKSAPRELWKNIGIHTERGEESITRMMELFAGHDINHTRQIEAILKKK